MHPLGVWGLSHRYLMQSFLNIPSVLSSFLVLASPESWYCFVLSSIFSTHSTVTYSMILVTISQRECVNAEIINLGAELSAWRAFSPGYCAQSPVTCEAMLFSFMALTWVCDTHTYFLLKPTLIYQPNSTVCLELS